MYKWNIDFSERKFLRKIEKHRNKIDTLFDGLIELYRNAKFACKNCHQETSLSNVLYIETYGLPELMCPICGHRHVLATKEASEAYKAFPEDIYPEDIYIKRLVRTDKNQYCVLISSCDVDTRTATLITAINGIDLASTEESRI